MDTATELLGWVSSIILLATLMRQVYTQWRTRATAGVPKWLFIGQWTASVGYTVYTFLLHNRVYVSSNVAILATAIMGESLYEANLALKAIEDNVTAESISLAEQPKHAPK